MALTVEGAQVNEAYRLAQLQLSTEVVLAMQNIWRYLDVQAIDATFEGWLALAEKVGFTYASQSASLSAAYVDVFKKVELGSGASAGDLTLATLEAEAFRESMLYLGPVSIKYAMTKGVPLSQASDVALARTAASAQRHALNAGRRTILSDRTVVGYQRICAGNACAFCAMLASRGPIYLTKESASFRAHDSCKCIVEPIYDRSKIGQARTDQSRQLQQQWKSATKGYSGQDALNAFRRSRR